MKLNFYDGWNSILHIDTERICELKDIGNYLNVDREKEIHRIKVLKVG